jgi:ribosomal protein L12E/L44/L45/RPP1/RPP2
MPKMLSLDFRKDPPSLGGGGTDRIPAGVYRLKITGVSDPSNKSSTGKPMPVIRFSVVGPNEIGKRIQDNFVFPVPGSEDSAFGMQRFGGMLQAAGVDVPTDRGFKIDLDRLIGKELWAEVGDNTLPANNGRAERTISRVVEYKLPTDTPKAATAAPAVAPKAATPRRAAAPAPVQAEVFSDEAEVDEDESEELEEEVVAETSDDEFPF